MATRTRWPASWRPRPTGPGRSSTTIRQRKRFRTTPRSREERRESSETAPPEGRGLSFRKQKRICMATHAENESLQKLRDEIELFINSLSHPIVVEDEVE